MCSLFASIDGNFLLYIHFLFGDKLSRVQCNARCNELRGSKTSDLSNFKGTEHETFDSCEMKIRSFSVNFMTHQRLKRF